MNKLGNLKHTINTYYTGSFKRFTVVLVACLVAGHLVIQLFFPNFLVNLIGFFLLFYILYTQALIKDHYVFVLCIYGLSYFQYANVQGGIFNLLSFFILVAYMLIKRNFFLFKNPEKSINFILIILILSHFAGQVIKSQATIDQKLLGTISFLGYILIFNLVSRLDISIERTKLFVSVTSLLLSYSLLISINKYFMIFNSSSPLFGGLRRFGSSNLAGTLGPSPTYGELGLLFLTFLLPFILSYTTQQTFKIKTHSIIISGLLALLTILMAASRSVIILAMISFCVYLLVFNFVFSRRTVNLARNFGIILILGAAFLIIAPSLNLNYVFERFETVNPEEINLNTVISGEGIHRATAFEIGRNMIDRESWIVGYGWGTIQENRLAWFGDKNFFRSDPHSIYYSLPMLFGWVGSIAFILMFLIVIFRLFRLCFLHAGKLREFLLPCFGLAFSLVCFLINEYKITALSTPHYFMIIWIWLGLGNSYVNKFTKMKRSENNGNDKYIVRQNNLV